MHPALTKDDIIVEILEHLALIQRPPKLDSALRTSRYWRPPATSPELFTSCAEDDIAICKRHALHSLALTCKAFSAHALNELWAAPLGGLYSVLKLFSSFIAKDGRIGVPSHRFDTTKPLLQHYVSITPANSCGNRRGLNPVSYVVLRRGDNAKRMVHFQEVCRSRP